MSVNFNNKKMKKIIITSILFMLVSLARGQVFIGTNPTGNPVLLEVKSDDRGVLIPRISIPDTLSASPVNNPKEGLLVMNTYQGKEGLFFWNGNAWEQVRTASSIAPDLMEMGKRGFFIGTLKDADFKLERNTYKRVPLKASFGKVSSDGHTYVIPEDGVYEVTATCAGKAANQQEGIFMLYIYNNTSKNEMHTLGYTRVYQGASYVDISAKTVFNGLLAKGDSIGIAAVWGTNASSAPDTAKAAILSVKKISTK
jgi:hypothetical protein